MAGLSRVFTRVKRLVLCQNNKKEMKKSNQYRIPPRSEIGKKRFHTLNGLSDSTFESWGFWFYRTTFMRIILAFVMVYFCCIICFSLLLHLSVVAAYKWKGRECCSGYDYSDLRLRASFEIVFELSWTTFATVGYGAVSIPADQDCQGVRYMLATEAFIGILFSSFCSAIFYTKIARLHTRAHVTFSSAMCLQYGEGVTASPIDFLPSVSGTCIVPYNKVTSV
jgi:hypothetical protein